jgi:hypothetical protein
MRSSKSQHRGAVVLLNVVVACAVLVAQMIDVATMEESSAAAQEAPVTTSGSTMTYDDDKFRELVDRYAEASGEGVDYGAWQASPEDMAALDSYIDLIGRVSPENHSDLFSSRETARRFWINAYNALVIDAVLDYWPLDSVKDIKVSLTSRIIPGKGLFYDREVVVAGERMNLLDLEEKILETFSDPRLHFALNCASDSCPVIRASDWSEAELDQAAREFVNNPENVEVLGERLYVSRIFKWYRDEFPDDLAGYLARFANEPLKSDLTAASAADYPVRYQAYDWSLNDSAH